MSIFDDFIVRAFVAGLAVACASSPLGCLVTWRRMAYFGDAIAHASLLGIALSFLLDINMTAAILAITCLIALCLADLGERGFASDTLLGVFAHSGLALGIVAASFLSGRQIDLMSYLLGDILAISLSDLIVIWVGVMAILALVIWRWNRLLLVTISHDLAKAENVHPKLENRLFMVSLAILVAISIKIVGILLIAALLIIPPVTARTFVKSPEHMAVLAGAISIFCLISGIYFSVEFDTPTGATIICVASLCFAISSSVKLMQRP